MAGRAGHIDSWQAPEQGAGGFVIGAVLVDLAKAQMGQPLVCTGCYEGRPSFGWAHQAVGLAVFDEIEAQHLTACAASIGKRLMGGVNTLAQRFDMIGDVRGIGMTIGIELVQDRSNQTPAAPQTAQLLELMKQKQVLLSSEGPHGNVLKIKPPLVFGEAECDYFLTALAASLGELVR